MPRGRHSSAGARPSRTRRCRTGGSGAAAVAVARSVWFGGRRQRFAARCWPGGVQPARGRVRQRRARACRVRPRPHERLQRRCHGAVSVRADDRPAPTLAGGELAAVPL